MSGAAVLEDGCSWARRLLDAGVRGDQLLVAFVIGARARRGTFVADVPELMSLTGRGRTTVRAALKALDSQRWLEVRQRGAGGAPGRGRWTTYGLIDPALWQRSEIVSPGDTFSPATRPPDDTFSVLEGGESVAPQQGLGSETAGACQEPTLSPLAMVPPGPPSRRASSGGGGGGDAHARDDKPRQIPALGVIDGGAVALVLERLPGQLGVAARRPDGRPYAERAIRSRLAQGWTPEKLLAYIGAVYDDDGAPIARPGGLIERLTDPTGTALHERRRREGSDKPTPIPDRYQRRGPGTPPPPDLRDKVAAARGAGA